MDADRFDTLIRSLSEGTTRRGITRLLGGLALGALLCPLSLAAKKDGNHKNGGKDQGTGKKGDNDQDRNEKGTQDTTGKDPDATVAARATMPTKFNPPQKYYLALGDSLAFGFQFAIFNQYFPSVPPDLFVHGYVDDLSQLLHPIRPDIETINYGCPVETTDSFIGGGCLYTAQGHQLHASYSVSQLEAAIAFLRSHQGQVSPITFNLGSNDLNVLPGLCGGDVSCYELHLAQIAENLDEILGALRAVAPNSEILTFTNYNVAFLVNPNSSQLTEAFNKVVEDTAAAHGVRVADVYAAFNGKKLPQPATICDLTLVCTALQDGHPSDAGYQVIAEQLWDASEYKKLGD